MNELSSAQLEAECDSVFRSEFSNHLTSHLAKWYITNVTTVNETVHSIEQCDTRDWETYIRASSAASHPWYIVLYQSGLIGSYSSFFQEEKRMPAFIPLLRSVREGLETLRSREAIDRNIYEETFPVPHSDLFQKMVNTVKAQATGNPIYDDCLANTNLVFYYGHFMNKWFAVGALYATECMVPRRTLLMYKGLQKLGFPDADLEFLKVHSEVDVIHANEWMTEIILPCLLEKPNARRQIIEGIAMRLHTSSKYLDRLVKQHFPQKCLEVSTCVKN